MRRKNTNIRKNNTNKKTNFRRTSWTKGEKYAAIRIIYGLVVLFLLIGSVFCHKIVSDSVPHWSDKSSLESADNHIETLSPVEETEDSYDLTSITFAGSCTTGSMLGSNAFGTFGSVYSESGADFFLDRLSDVLINDDLTVAECDVVLSDSDTLKASDKDVREWYRGSAEMASIFSKGGVDALSMTGERCFDYGSAGYSDTLNSLRGYNILCADNGGVITREFRCGLTTAVYCTTLKGDNSATLEWLRSHSESYDFTVVYVRDNGNGSTVSPEKRLAFRSFADAGADLVVGTNSSCLQPSEKYNGRIIVYSLGALIDGAVKFPEKYTSLLSVNIKSKGKNIIDISYEFIPCGTYDDKYSWRPYILHDSTEKDTMVTYISGDQS